MQKKRKTYRRGNGEGTVYNLGKGRSKPWVAKVFVQNELAETKRGMRQVYKTIGYYFTKQEAQMALLEYNKNPDDINFAKQVENKTFNDVFEEWFDMLPKDISKNTVKGHLFAYQHCKKIVNRKIKSLRTIDFQNVINDCSLSDSSKIKIKSLMVSVCKYAEMNDYINKNYASFLPAINEKQSDLHQPFTKEELRILWEHKDMPYVDTILIMIYTGFRINELLEMENCKNIDIENKTMKGGFKTNAGKDRIVPIHSSIMPLVMNHYDPAQKYFIRNKRNGSRMKYQNYRNNYFDKIMIKLKMEHLPHDCRHTFATLLNDAEANSTSIMKLIGHSSFDITEKIYTHKDIEELRKAIELI